MIILKNIISLKIILGILSVLMISLPHNLAKASEADFLKGVMGAIIVNGIIQGAKKDNQPVIFRKQITYVNPYNSHSNSQYSKKNKHLTYDTIPQRAFKSQASSIRYNIQGELMKMGYYNGRLDGYWGYKTEHAISSYAVDSNKIHLLTSIRGVNILFKDLLYKVPNHHDQQLELKQLEQNS